MRHIRTDGSAEPSCGAIAARITVNTAARPHRPDDIFGSNLLQGEGRILRLFRSPPPPAPHPQKQFCCSFYYHRISFTTEYYYWLRAGKEVVRLNRVTELRAARVVFITRHEEDWTDGALVDLRQPVWQPPASPAPSRRDSWC